MSLLLAEEHLVNVHMHWSEVRPMERAGLGAPAPLSSSSALPGAAAGRGSRWAGTQRRGPRASQLMASAALCTASIMYCYQHSRLVYSPLSGMLGVSLLPSPSSSVSACTRQHLAQVCFPHSVSPADCSPDSDTERAIKVEVNLDRGK